MTAHEDAIGTVSSVPSGGPGGQVNLSYPDRGHHLRDSRAGWQTVRHLLHRDGLTAAATVDFFKINKRYQVVFFVSAAIC